MKRKSLAGPVIKSAIFIAVTVTVTAILGISIAHSGVSATVGYQAVFSDVTGLVVGNDVDIAGVRIGTVTSISVYHHNLALVDFALQQGRQLPVSATATPGLHRRSSATSGRTTLRLAFSERTSPSSTSSVSAATYKIGRAHV